MCSFGLSFIAESETQAAHAQRLRIPPTFRCARITLGDFSETTYSDTTVWSVADYEAHRRITSRRCVEQHENVIFCSSISADTAELAELWVCFRDEASVQIQNVRAKRSKFIVDGSRVGWKWHDWRWRARRRPLPNASVWTVPIGYLKCLAERTG